jgi:DNA polymerase-3 subunit epsilon
VKSPKANNRIEEEPSMTRAPALFPLERLADIPDRPEDFRLLERIPLTREPQSWPLELSAMVGDEQPMVLLDTETTGLSADDESIIELGMVKVLYSPSTKRIVSIVDVISLYEDPGKPIPELITELTGITDEMV